MDKNLTSSQYDNAGYIKDDGNSVVAGVPLEPPPYQFIPRIIPNTDFSGQHLKRTSDSVEDIPKQGYIATISDPNLDSNEDDEGGGDNRDTWDSPVEFLLSCVSMSVGLGNIWRFPGVAARNGGGAFLIPYLCVLLLIGRPIYYLEMCLGQFSRYGQVKVWNMMPLFKGVGYGTIIGSISLTSYYVPIMAITVYFFFGSFAKTLPWAVCHQDKHPDKSCDDPQANNASLYYYHTVNPQVPDIDNGLGKLSWQLSLCLILSWILIFLALVKGVKSSGKVAYFTAIFPYVVLLILLIRGVTLEGAWEGIKIFLEPKWGDIVKPKVWYAAIEQCFFSLGIGFGPVIMFSSYNSFKQDIYRDALIISVLDTCTSFLAGITVFSVIGHVMVTTNKKFEDVEGVGGPGLPFILYPQVIASFDWVPQLFAVLFFLMFFTLGIGTATSYTGGIITLICDQFPTWKRWLVTLVVSSIGTFVGLMYVTEGGMFMLDLIDHYGAGFITYLMVSLECIGISWVYGLGNFCNDIEFMIGRRPGIYWRACWGFIIPVGLTANLLYYLIDEPTFTYGGVDYPAVATVCGWLLTAFAFGLVPAWAIHAIATRKADNLKEKFQLTLKPTHRWGPQKPKLRKEWQEFRAMKDAQHTKKRFLIF